MQNLRSGKELSSAPTKTYGFAAILVNDIGGTEVVPVTSFEEALLYLRDRAKNWETAQDVDLSQASLAELNMLYADGEPSETLMLDIGTLQQPWESSQIAEA